MLPEGVSTDISGGSIVVKGPKGELSWQVPAGISIAKENGELKIEMNSNGKRANSSALWGTARSVVANMVAGVKEGYEKKLEIEGIGFKAQAQGNKLVLSVGFSHPVEMEMPPGISFKVEKNMITVSGLDKVQVGEVAANIRKVKKPEPYKGKGIRYLGEIVRRKAGKKATASA